MPYYGFKVKKTDERYTKYAEQRKLRGFDDTETWSLDMTIAKFVEPRLRRLKEVKNGHPYDLTEEQWDEILDKIIDGFAVLKQETPFWVLDKKDQRIVTGGLKLFHKWFFNLWW